MQYSKDSLGDRMKGYEAVYKHKAVRRVPLLVRVDGKAFHTLTKKATKPFDRAIMSSMVTAAHYTAREIQGCKAVYVQSDEATFLLTDYDEIETQPWFGYDQQKLCSVIASYMTIWFNRCLELHHFVVENYTAVFDARIFSVPQDDVVNAFLLRAKDWERNSVSMYCQSFFSTKEMHGQGRADQHEMLHSIGKNWTTDLTERQRNGTFLVKEFTVGANYGGWVFEEKFVKPNYQDINELLHRYIYPE